VAFSRIDDDIKRSMMLISYDQIVFSRNVQAPEKLASIEDRRASRFGGRLVETVEVVLPHCYSPNETPAERNNII
jgi:hypothetical protein